MSERTGLWLYRALAVVVALALWYVTVAEKRLQQAEKLVEATVTYNNRPDGVTVLDSRDVRVRLRGSNQDIRRLRPLDVDVQIDLTGIEKRPGPVSIPLEESNVLPPHDGFTVMSIEPSTLTLQIDVIEQRRVGILIEAVGEPAAGATVESIDSFPTTALFEGARSLLQQLPDPLTLPISLDGHAIDFEEQVPVISPSSAVRVLNPAFIRVSVQLEEPPPIGAAAGGASLPAPAPEATLSQNRAGGGP